MKIIWRDKKAPHQLHVEVASDGTMTAKCNCGQKFAHGKTLHGGTLAESYWAHMEDVKLQEASRERAERFH